MYYCAMQTQNMSELNAYRNLLVHARLKKSEELFSNSSDEHTISAITEVLNNQPNSDICDVINKDDDKKSEISKLVIVTRSFNSKIWNELYYKIQEILERKIVDSIYIFLKENIESPKYKNLFSEYIERNDANINIYKIQDVVAPNFIMLGRAVWLRKDKYSATISFNNMLIYEYVNSIFSILINHSKNMNKLL